MLQSAEYARHVFEGVPGSSPDAVGRAVAARVDRQSVLYEPGRESVFVLTEAVLRTWPGSPALMLAQLDRLLAVESLSTVRLGVVRTHPDDDPALGTPLDPDRYDYRAAVLWNAHAGALWARFTTYLRQQLASRAGITRSALRDCLKVSYAKVAEYQRRGAVHFHAVIRLDGPDGAEDAPPAWATTELLADAIRTAARLAETPGPVLDGHAYAFRFGTQLDVRPIHSADFAGTSELSSRAVAAYIAKYATKGAETAGTLDRPVRNPITDLIGSGVTDHARRMILTCWHLGALPELEDLRLRKWAHMLGFRGHFSTKSRAYSVTLGALRQERADHNEALTRERAAEAGHPLPDPDTVLVLSHWRFAGTGLTDAETWLATTREPSSGSEGDAAA